MTVTTTLPKAGIIGSGSFGLALSKLLSINAQVLILMRDPSLAAAINEQHTLRGVALPKHVKATTSPEQLAQECQTIFPAIPSQYFREMMQTVGAFLRPRHYLIHCVKGFDVSAPPATQLGLSRHEIHTMSEVIAEESPVLRIGCLSGPNIAQEIIDGQPTATVIASEFSEVIKEGQDLLSSNVFFVFGAHDIIGAEIAGALKNIYALGSGYLAGKKLGKNIQSMLITRGLHEIVYFGKAMGAATGSFLGTAGIGDLIATATSPDSRNYRFGYRLGQGENLSDVQASFSETAEGVRTLSIAMQLANHYQIRVPITFMLYKIVYDNFRFEAALDYLMRYPYAQDVDFI
ncbi:MAG TPA: NAD(P)H-dependent glycerol-3-phosphate dehydrogenase [Saprospiraceae bacterium]|nr:NAD(P)H-dependent glycerol-3-phosphate dehydrogenase [Saprospiraceae bacterium]